MVRWVVGHLLLFLRKARCIIKSYDLLRTPVRLHSTTARMLQKAPRCKILEAWYPDPEASAF